jgi:hypothetical protein
MKKVIQKKQGRKWKLIMLCLIAMAFILFAGNIILSRVIQNKVRQNLDQLAPVAKVSFSSVNANLFASALSINNLAIQFAPDTTDQQQHHLFYFPKAEFKGISFLKVIFNKKLFINELRLEPGEIKLDASLLYKKDPAHNTPLPKMPFKNIWINHLEIKMTNVWLHSGAITKPLMKGSIQIDDVSLNDQSNSSSQNNFRFSALACNISDINYSIPNFNHTVEIKKLSLDSKKGFLKMDSLHITPEYPKAGFAENTQHQLNHLEASISTIEILKLDVMDLFNKEFIAGSIHIKEVNAHVNGSKEIFKNLQPITVAYLKQIPKEIGIDTFKMDHSSLECTGFSEEDLKGNKNIFDSTYLQNISIKHLEVSQTNIALHSVNSNNRDQFNVERFDIDSLNLSKNDFHFDAISCSLSKINYALPGSYRTLHLNRLMMDSRKGSLLMDSLKISTQYSKFDFGRKLGHQADFVEGSFPRIEFSKLNFMQLQNKKLVADKLIIDNSNLYFFRDRRLPRELKKQPMPNGYFKEIPLEVRINSLQLNNAFVISEEFPKKGTQSGMLKMEKLNLSMSPVLNHPDKNDPQYSITSVKGSIMDAGTIEATIRAPLEKNVYFIQGAIKNLDLPKLNASSENLGNFHIESGVLNNLDFHFTATEQKATGKIVGEYHDLVIDRLKDKNGEKKIAKVPTFFLKHAIIPKNKDKSMAVSKRTGEIDYDRDPTRLVTFYLLKALLSGIRSSFDLGFLLPQ